MARFDCVDRILVKFFYSYGKVIARHPLVFFLGSLIVATGLGLGLIFIHLETDVMYLFTPETSTAREEADVIYDLFPVQYDAYLPNRGKGITDQGASVIVTPVHGNDVIKEDVVNEILRFNTGVRDITVILDDGSVLSYRDLCAIWMGDCLANPVLHSFMYNASYTRGMNLTHPFYPPTETSAIFIAASLGDVTVDPADNVTITRAGFLSISYSLQSTSELEALSRKWEKNFVKYARDFTSDKISVSFIVSHSLEVEITSLTLTILPYFMVSCILLVSFAVASCLVADWVLSKATLGTLGLMSAVLAIASASGLLCYIGIPFNIVAASMPFLIIGIGIDDMFIMLAAWRKTSPFDIVEERMGQAYSEAAVSITITSITDALAFGIGSITPLPAVRVFCLYTGVAVIFDYLFQITFFGACMVYTGRREANNRHCITFKKVVPRKEAKSKWYKLLCAGGFSKEDSVMKSQKLCEPALMTFFKDHFGPALMTTPAKITALLLFCGYVAGAVYGCLNITEGLEMKSLAGDGSITYNYFDYLAKYFSEYGPAVSVAIRDDLDYSDPAIQQELERIVQDFESSPYMHSFMYTEFWLRDYLEFLKMLQLSSAMKRELFMTVLVEQFLQHPAFLKYSQDIVFKEGSNSTEIAASRFVILSKDMYTTTEQMAMMKDIRERAKKFDVNMTTFSPMFIIYEQFVVVRPLTIQNLLIATACMFFIALILIPHPFCAFMVTVCIVSIQVGIFGYMSLWNVRLDGISMINIILCIGFSVDFSAHVTYAFMSESENLGNERHANLSAPKRRAVMALYSLGMPILQGAISTILGIVILMWSPSYIFRAFFKVMFLVMMFGMLHSLIFLPVVLSTFGGCLRAATPSSDVYKMKKAAKVTTKEADLPRCYTISTQVSWTDLSLSRNVHHADFGAQGDDTSIAPPHVALSYSEQEQTVL